MSYYPLFRTKANELLAVRELSAGIASRGNIFPLFEPVTERDTTINTLEAISLAGVRYGVIMNPSVGPMKGPPISKIDGFLKALAASKAKFTPFLFIHVDTPVSLFQRFTARFTSELGVIFADVPTDPALIAAVQKEKRVVHIVAVEDRTPAGFLNSFNKQFLVTFRDRFNRQARNADYPSDELFCDPSIITANAAGKHFGDYSIAGSHFASSGGPAYAVALHHVYYHGNKGLHIRHYLSDDTSTPTDPAGKFIQALGKLVRDLKGLGTINNTTVCDTYRTLFTQGHYPNLGPAKKFALKHHLELMLQ